jgi:hypothetical protein
VHVKVSFLVGSGSGYLEMAKTSKAEDVRRATRKGKELGVQHKQAKRKIALKTSIAVQPLARLDENRLQAPRTRNSQGRHSRVRARVDEKPLPTSSENRSNRRKGSFAAIAATLLPHKPQAGSAENKAGGQTPPSICINTLPDVILGDIFALLDAPEACKCVPCHSAVATDNALAVAQCMDTTEHPAVADQCQGRASTRLQEVAPHPEAATADVEGRSCLHCTSCLLQMRSKGPARSTCSLEEPGTMQEVHLDFKSQTATAKQQLTLPNCGARPPSPPEVPKPAPAPNSATLHTAVEGWLRPRACAIQSLSLMYGCQSISSVLSCVP